MENIDVRNSDRKRGRPAGSNRVPLSIEERRARNAQYERERRIETSAALSELAEALQCEPTSSNADILATAVRELQRLANRNTSEHNILELKRCNAKLMQQIENIEHRLSSYEDRVEGKTKKNIIKQGGIKKENKSRKKNSNSISHSITQKIKPRGVDNLAENREPLYEITQSTCEDTQINIKLSL